MTSLLTIKLTKKICQFISFYVEITEFLIVILMQQVIRSTSILKLEKDLS